MHRHQRNALFFLVETVLMVMLSGVVWLAVIAPWVTNRDPVAFVQASIILGAAILGADLVIAATHWAIRFRVFR